MLKRFRLHEPASVDEALSILADYGDDAGVYAGGTELLLAMKEGLLHYDHLVNIKTIPGFDDVALAGAGGALRIGAAATHRSLEQSPVLRRACPLLADVERRVANVRVRNVGTIGGNLCFAEPHSDVAAALLLFDAEVEAAGPAGRRRFPVEELAVDPYETCLQPGELLTQVYVPALPQGMTGAYLKFGYLERPTLGIGAAVGTDPDPGAGARIREARIAVGSAGPRPIRARQAEAVLRGATVLELLGDGASEDSPLLKEAARLTIEAADPQDDLHGSAVYKEQLIKVFLKRALHAAVST